ncbi:MAG: hypothetical protein JSW36_15635 [Burkholderiales bacterium]|nr:MAG: hypothetical protein JSW36_15635 [Burkholderiales bacterium]
MLARRSINALPGVNAALQREMIEEGLIKARAPPRWRRWQQPNAKRCTIPLVVTNRASER